MGIMWAWSVFVLSAAALGATVATPPPPQPPNVLLFVADDLGWNDVSYHGSEIQTPNIDRLAADGVTLENYYVQPICTPSRSQLMSGRYQIHTGMQHSVIWRTTPKCLPTHIPTLAVKLKEAGYATHMLGKWHLGFYKEACTPTHRGFDTFFGYLGGKEDYYTHSDGAYDFRDVRDGGEEVSTKELTGQYSTHLLSRRAEDIARQHVDEARAEPLFTYLAYQAVHSPLQAPDSYTEPYADSVGGSNRMIFAGMAAAMDEGIGNVTQTYKDLGLWENTLVIFTTDNGAVVRLGGNNWPLRGEKNTLWDGGVHGVGLISGGLLKDVAGAVNEELIHISDWFPTLVHLAGGNTRGPHMDGFDVWDAFRPDGVSPRKELLHTIDPLWPSVGEPYPDAPFDSRVRAAIRDRRYKLITGGVGAAPGKNGWFHVDAAHSVPSLDTKGKNLWLFDIEHDPLETIDLSEEKEDVVRRLLGRLAYYNSTAVPCVFPPHDPRGMPRHGDIWGPWM